MTNGGPMQHRKAGLLCSFGLLLSSYCVPVALAGPCNPTVTAPTANETISGTFQLAVNPSCQLQSGWFIRFYFDQSGHNVTYSQFPGGATTNDFNTTELPDGSYQSGVIVWDATGLIIEGRDTGPSFTILNGGPTPTPTATPTPTPTATPTPGPTPTPGGIVPNGAQPPPGQSWHVTFDDEFDRDSAIDTSKWNGGAGAPGGAVPWCPDPTDVQGNQPCSEDYSRTYIQPGVGVAIQPVVNPSLPFGGSVGLQPHE